MKNNRVDPVLVDLHQHLLDREEAELLSQMEEAGIMAVDIDDAKTYKKLQELDWQEYEIQRGL